MAAKISKPQFLGGVMLFFLILASLVTTVGAFIGWLAKPSNFLLAISGAGLFATVFSVLMLLRTVAIHDKWREGKVSPIVSSGPVAKEGERRTHGGITAGFVGAFALWFVAVQIGLGNQPGLPAANTAAWLVLVLAGFGLLCWFLAAVASRRALSLHEPVPRPDYASPPYIPVPAVPWAAAFVVAVAFTIVFAVECIAKWKVGANASPLAFLALVGFVALSIGCGGRAAFIKSR